MTALSNSAVAHDLSVDEVQPHLRAVVSRPGGPSGSRVKPVSNMRVAMAMFLVAESMFFAGLIGAYLVLRVGSVVWPPAGLPALPLGITVFNTVFLLLSSVTMAWSLAAIRRDDVSGLSRWLMATGVLGAAFVAVQGSEWVQLVHHGLTLSSGPYGGTFYVLIGAHALHVVGALIWLLSVAAMARRGRYAKATHDGVEACAIYWFYVCALWGLLFWMVYL